MKVLWICGLPNQVRASGTDHYLTEVQTPAWSWVLGHLPPPEGVELHILCPVLRQNDELTEFDYQGAHWHCVRQDNHELLFLWLRVYRKMKPIAARISPDVIHGWGGETGCGWLATLLSKDSIVSVQGLLRLFSSMVAESRRRTFKQRVLSTVHSGLESWTYHRAGQLLVESRTCGKELERYYGCSARLVPHPLRKEFLESLNFQRNHELVNVVFVGSLEKRKGPLDALKAFAAQRDDRLRLFMIGTGELENEVVEFIERTKLRNRIKLVSVCSSGDVQRYMRESSVFLLPSYGDTGPTALKEAISQGCVPVCYDNTGPHELVSEYGGFLAQTGDVDDLAMKLHAAICCVQENPVAGRDVAERVRARLSPASIWRELLDVYEGALT